MPFSNLIGNEPAKSLLAKMASSRRVPHALLFAGPPGVGKSSFAKAFAALLMGPSHANKLKSGNHPDLHLLQPEGKSHTHSIDTIRALIDEASLPPFEAPIKLFILSDAEKMLPSASNALLKTLEEPPPHTHFILLTTFADAVLPTILSRCQKISFFPIPHP